MRRVLHARREANANTPRWRWISPCCHRLCAAEQLRIEPPAGEQHVVERLVDIGGNDRAAAVTREAGLRQAPDQLLDERTARALAAPGGLGDDGVVERQSFAVELDQLAAAGLVGKGHLD